MIDRIRKTVRERAKSRSEYCHLPDEFDELPFHIDHVIAMMHHGSDDMGNLAWCCSYDNLRKGTNLARFDPDSGQLTRLFNPRIDVWSDHFVWQATILVGISDIGRTTIDVLQMNNKQRLQQRSILIREGWEQKV
jgi:HNH endonuclease